MTTTNLSETSEYPTVLGVFKYICRHPFEMLIRRWNWKAAILSGFMRGSIYFFTHISLGFRAAMGAMSVEFAFRVVNTGASASVSQAFRKARPKWVATLFILALMPTYAHIIEYTLHTLSGDVNKNKSIIVSICFSATSALFNLYAMRRGALLVSDTEQQSFHKDLIRLPRIALDFAAYPILWLINRMRSKPSDV